MKKYFIKQQVLLGEINGEVEEMVVGYRTVISYGKEQDAVDKFEKMSNNLKKCGIKAQIFGGVMGPCMNLISNFGFILIAAFGGWFAIKGFITVGTIQAFILYSKQFSRPINEIANQFANIQTAIAGAERIFEVMDADKETDEGKADFEVENVKGDISFKHIDFSYVPEKQVLKDLDLEVKAGQKIAIVGATGSGKTTIVNLLTRFYPVDSGEITIDGQSIYDIPKDKLRRSIAIVLQDTVLFKDTIEENIRYGRENATLDEIKAAAKFANADEFIERLSEGYDTVLAEGGSNLSQGQRQLLSIARAVLADPKILILDEATSSVDTRTEMHIQSAMVALMKNRTSLIIAHRLSTIRDADKIVVIDGGRVAEQGSHEELIAAKGCYYRLYQTQFSGVKTIQFVWKTYIADIVHSNKSRHRKTSPVPFFMRKKRTALIRKPSLMLSEILLCNKCQSISCNEKLFVCWDNVNLCLRIVCGYLLEDSTAEVFLSVNVDTEDIEI